MRRKRLKEMGAGLLALLCLLVSLTGANGAEGTEANMKPTAQNE